jgi:hypothetical protein
MTAQAAALEIAETGSNSIRTIAGALLLACDLIDDLQIGKPLSAHDVEFIEHCRDLAQDAHK